MMGTKTMQQPRKAFWSDKHSRYSGAQDGSFCKADKATLHSLSDGTETTSETGTSPCP